MISYAQNYEDVILWRVLKEIKNGFYIDIGANHPEIDSVTKYFYDNGWFGINIEPEPEYFNLLSKFRTKDINLNIAISSDKKKMPFCISKVRGWSTNNQKVIESIEKSNSSKKTINIKAERLDKIIQDRNIATIHFIKIDTEGSEKDVLKSFINDANIRAWIIVIEALFPNTQIDTSSEWEYMLLNNNYKLVYFDGLNKYYLSNEKYKLQEKFKLPPNIFDNFIRKREFDLNKKIVELEKEINIVKQREEEANQRTLEFEKS